MPKVGLNEAAKLTGRSASTITRAANSGRLSFSMDSADKREFDTSELDRVFGVTPPEDSDARVHVRADASSRTSAKEADATAAWDRERVLLEDKVRLLQDQVDRERDINEGLMRQNQQLLLVLTDQREQPRSSVPGSSSSDQDESATSKDRVEGESQTSEPLKSIDVDASACAKSLHDASINGQVAETVSEPKHAAQNSAIFPAEGKGAEQQHVPMEVPKRGLLARLFGG